MSEQGYYATPAEQEQRKMAALESIADSLLEIKQILATSTWGDGTLLITTQEAIY